MTFTAWGIDGYAHTLIQGEGPPRFVDGSSDETAPELIWTIEADTQDEAFRQYYDLQGWKPYKPMESQ